MTVMVDLNRIPRMNRIEQWAFTRRGKGCFVKGQWRPYRLLNWKHLGLLYRWRYRRFWKGQA